MVKESLDMAVVAEEVAAYFFLVFLEERADYFGKISNQDAVDFILGVENTE